MPAQLAGKFNQISRRPLYRAYEDGRASLSNPYAHMGTLTIEIIKPSSAKRAESSERIPQDQ
jgi:hypothetical protein